MRQQRSILRDAVVVLFALVFLPGWVYGMGVEVEPNDPCASAQDLTSGLIYDGMYGEIAPLDVDFFRMWRDPGREYLVDLEGSLNPEFPDGYPLGDPYLGVFDSSCNLMDSDDDSGDGLNSRLAFTVPADGIFVLAASAYPDWNFDGSHADSGTYTLTITAVSATSSISGRVVDGSTSNPLPGAYVDLLECWDSLCTLSNWVNTQVTNAQGEFFFDSASSGSPLAPGLYKVSAWAPDYQPGSSGVFELLEGQAIDIGDIALVGPPVSFSEVSPCAYVPAIGGECEYSVRITNAEPETLRGAAWSLVTASGTGSYLGFTEFQAGGLERLVLPPGASAVVEFEFDVPGTVPQGTYICPSAWVGLGVSEPYFFTLGQMQPLFCVYKGIADSYMLVTGAEAQAVFQQMNAQQNRKVPARREK